MTAGSIRGVTSIEGHGGDQIVATLRTHGLEQLYTLIGGHIFPVLDAAERHGLRLIDVRHEQAAAFAAEAHGKLARMPGVAVTDAGPGALNTLNAIASARSNGAPMLLIAGHPPTGTAGMGMLNETSQRQVLEPLVKEEIAVADAGSIATETARALRLAGTRHRGPVYLDVPMDVLFGQASGEVAPATPSEDAEPAGDLAGAVRLLAEAERPVVLLGSDVWADSAEKAARALVEQLRVPAFMNGMGRGVLPADHALAFSGARKHAFTRADVVVIVGTPLDFRIGFGHFGEAKVIHLADHPSGLAAAAAVGVAGPLTTLLEALSDAGARDHDAWIAELRKVEDQRRRAFDAELRSDATPIHPVRVYGELVPRLARDGVVIADGGDFASYAGRFVQVFEPGGWLDPGPYGCLGTSAGYALAAGTLFRGRQIVVLLGDGAAGFSLADWDTLVRHEIDVTLVCGNNGVWGLEKAPMQGLFGRDVIADLAPGTRYDQVMEAFGGRGSLVTEPGEIAPALERALATPGPSLVNVLTDPAVPYPRGA